jgi:uncharacterized protein YndB with AHSA1/START domain
MRQGEARRLRRDVRIERVLPYPRARVWRALTDARVLSDRLMPTDFAPELGRAFTFSMKPQAGWDGITHCVITELVEGERVACSYRGHARGDKPIACAGVESERVRSMGRGLFADLDTVLRFALSDAPGGTRLRLDHTGFEGWKLVLVSLVMGRGWKKILRTRLPGALARMA